MVFFFAILIAWGADGFSSHEEYQNILKYYLQNLVISYVSKLKLLEVLFKAIYTVVIISFFLGIKKRDLPDKTRNGEDSKKAKKAIV